MPEDFEMMEEEIPEEFLAEDPMETGEVPPGGGMPPGEGTIIANATDVPELSGLTQGDTLMFTIVNVSDDGTYELLPQTAEVEV